jgi:hypothetical protein
MHAMEVEVMPIANLRPYPRNARTHSRKQIKQIANSIQRFGFTNPVLISDENEIVAGHGRVEAAKLIGYSTVPTLRLAHLNAAERRAYVIADNKLALNAGWDREILAIELQSLIDTDFDVELTGFSLAEVDFVLDEARESSVHSSVGPEDDVPPLGDASSAVSFAGDVWQLGRHRLTCGDSRLATTIELLMKGERAHVIFTDPPYNLPIGGHVSGLGRTCHPEFAMGSGEMTSDAFTHFLKETLGNAAAVAGDGSIAFVCMDWRHMGSKTSPWSANGTSPVVRETVERLILPSGSGIPF